MIATAKKKRGGGDLLITKPIPDCCKVWIWFFALILSDIKRYKCSAATSCTLDHFVFAHWNGGGGGGIARMDTPKYGETLKFVYINYQPILVKAY